MPKLMDRQELRVALAVCTVCGRRLGIGVMLFLLALAPRTALAAERLILCHGSEASALAPLASLRRFYAAEGVDVAVRKFPSGFQAMEAMLAGQCSMATAAVPPVVHQSLRRNDFRILATISSSGNYEKLIVRNDRGIRSVADLRGRRIAVAESTSAHFFLDMFLVAHGLKPGDVRKVYLSPQEVGPAFRRGDVDAAAHWEPTLQILAKEFGKRTQVLSTAGLIISHFLLLCRQDYVQQHPVVVERVLRALLRAEQFAKVRPAMARVQLAHYFGREQTEFDYIWSLHDYHVSLDQPLLFALENVARWRMGQLPPAQRQTIPNYLHFIYLDGLKAVRPQAVSIIH